MPVRQTAVAPAWRFESRRSLSRRRKAEAPDRRIPTAWAPGLSIRRVNDADLVARALAGDTSAFGELVDRHRSAVFRVAFTALGSHAEADDAAQDACVVAFERLHTFRGEASFKTWLLTIVWHQAINRRRSVMRWLKRTVAPAHQREDAAHEAMDVASGDDSPEQRLATGQMRRAIVEEIRRLSPTLRDALLLAQSGDYTYAEIGAMLGVPTGTIKWRVSEARRVIKTRLRQRGFVDVG
jgi:RNA polymerase sigma-70 factor, ECF subfamily